MERVTVRQARLKFAELLWGKGRVVVTSRGVEVRAMVSPEEGLALERLEGAGQLGGFLDDWVRNWKE